jgi:hypothetical protein
LLNANTRATEGRRFSRRRNRYLALRDEVGFGGVPCGAPAGGVTEGEDVGLSGGGGGDGRAEEGERRVEADDGGRGGVVLRQFAGAPAVGRSRHREWGWG